VYGEYESWDLDDEEDLFIFTKTGPGKTSLTVANMSKASRSLGPIGRYFPAKLVLGNVDDTEEGTLRPYESRIYVSAH
jgi:hypothetical protein